MNYKIDWENLTESEAREILDGICGKFNVLAKTQNNKGVDDVSYLETHGSYDDNFHANEMSSVNCQLPSEHSTDAARYILGNFT